MEHILFKKKIQNSKAYNVNLKMLLLIEENEKPHKKQKKIKEYNKA